MRILIQNASVVTMDSSLGDFERADIFVDEGKIVAVGPTLLAEADEVLDASGMIAMPGMIDTHRHTWQTGLRGILADGNIPDYLRGFRIQMAERYRPEDMYAGNYLGGLDAINSGVTTIVDYCHNLLGLEYARASVNGLMDSGVRALYGHGMVPVTSNTWGEAMGGANEGPNVNEFRTRAKWARDIKSEFFSSDNQLLRMAIAPQELAIAPASEVSLEFALARELGARITMHANQVLVPRLFKDVEVLHQNRLLDDDLLLVHCTFNTDQEWQLLQDTGVMISVCAETEMQMGMGFPVIAEATRFTPGPSLGIDCTSSTGADMISHARLVLQVSRWKADQSSYSSMHMPTEMSWQTRDALRWLTLNGAKAAGLDHLVGSISIGKRADVVLLDMTGISQAGWNRRDIASAIIAQTNSGNVDTVMIDGKIVKRKGRLVHVDVKAAMASLQESTNYLWKQMDDNGGFIPEPLAVIPALDRD